MCCTGKPLSGKESAEKKVLILVPRVAVLPMYFKPRFLSQGILSWLKDLMSSTLWHSAGKV